MPGWSKTPAGVFAVAGGMATGVFFNPPDEIWLIYVGAPVVLLCGVVGALLGSLVDAGRLRARPLLGLLGLFVGAGAGFWLVSSAVNDSFAGGAFHGIFLGIPVGAAVGCLAGLLLGGKWETRRKDVGRRSR